MHRFQALGDEHFREFRIASKLRQAEQIVVELVGGVGAEIGVANFLLGQIDNGFQVFQPLMGEADRARRVAAVAAGFLGRRAFQHQDLDAVFRRRQGRAEGGVSRANDDNVVFRIGHRILPGAVKTEAIKRLRRVQSE